MASRRHILIVTSWYKTNDDHVGSPFVEEQARLLQRNNNQVGILATLWKSRKALMLRKNSRFHQAAYTDDGLPTFYCIMRSIIPLLRKLNYKYAIRRAWRTYVLYKKQYGKPDLLHAHSVLMGGVAARYISKREGIPFVLTEHLTNIIRDNGFIHPLDHAMAKQTYQRAGKVICVSSYQKAAMDEIFDIKDNRSCVVGNLVNPLFFENNRVIHPLGTGQEVVKIVFIGGFVYNKDPFLLMAALSNLLSRGINAHVDMIGTASETEINALHEVISKEGVNEHVHFIGRISRQSIRNYIDKAHFLVSTSHWETFGLNIAEALARGKPVVVTHSGGCRDFVNPTNGIIVEKRDPEIFADAMAQMVQHYNSYHFDDISQQCFNQFSDVTINQKLERIYGEVLSTDARR